MKEIFIHSEVYADRSRSWVKMPLNKFRQEICACVMLTDICDGIMNNNLSPHRFTIDMDRYIDILQSMGLKQKHMYRIVMRLQNSLSDYFCCNSIGYYMREIGASAPSYYYITDRMNDIIEKMILNKSSYYGYNLESIKTGCEIIKAYEYKGAIYESYHDIVKTIPMKFGEYADVLKNVKRITNVYSVPKTGLDDALTQILGVCAYKKKYFKEMHTDTCLEHTAKLSVTGLRILKEYEQEKGTDKNTLHILNTLLVNSAPDGTYVQQYYRGTHGRLYQHGFSIQMLNKEYRELILSDYADVDIKAATFSILWNFARKNGIKDDSMPTLYEYTYDPDNFRQKILSKLQISDRYVTLKYVKDILNAIAFGARLNESRVVSDIKNKTQYSIPVMLKGYDNPETPLNIIGIDEIQKLVNEIKYITGKLVVKYSDSNNILYNSIGLKQEQRPRMNYGKKLSHLYQGAEVQVLETILDYELNGSHLIDIPYAIGLLLHDGIYIRKNILKEINRKMPLDLYIEKKLGYSLKFS